MLQSESLERRPGKRKRALLVGASSSDRNRISTFLLTMGWTCAVVSGEPEMLAAVDREPFDALLLNLGHSGVCAEQAILGIRKIRPSLSERMVVISRGSLNPQTAELIERLDLVHLPNERLFSQLWSTLEGFFPNGRTHEPGSGSPRAARLMFDSFRLPSPAGVRTSPTSGRHLTYEHNSRLIEMFLDRPPGSERVSLVGQVLDTTKSGQGNPVLPVVLVDQSGTLARTTTNDAGEFNLEFKSAENLSLEIRLGERSWVSIPITLIDWATEETSDRATGT